MTAPHRIKTERASAAEKTGIKKHVAIGAPAAFFIFFFFYLLLRIDPAVIYSCNGFNLHSYVRYTRAATSADTEHPIHEPAPQTPYILELTGKYFRDIFSVPGGFTRLVVTAFIYLCHIPLLGALAMTGFAVLLFFLLRAYAFECRAPLPLILRLLPAVFLLCMCQWYDFMYMAFCVPAAAALTAAVCFQILPLKTTARLLAFGTVLFWLSYYLFQEACLLFCLLACMDCALRGHRALRAMATIMAVNCSMVFIAEAHLPPPEYSFQHAFSTVPAALPFAIMIYFPLVTILCSPLITGPLGKTPFARLRRSTRAAYVLPFLWVLVAAGAAAGLSGFPINREIRIVARTLHHLQNRAWNKILSENTSPLFKAPGAGDSPLTLFVTHATNFALGRTGQLGSNMFSYPQLYFSPEPLLLVQHTLLYGFVNWISAMDVFTDLGMLSQAEKTAGETMENMGPYPFLVYRRAILQIAKDNSSAAAVYLNRLAAMPFYRKEAQELLALLRNNAAVASDPRIAPLRANRDTADYLLFQKNEEEVLLTLLERNPRNKMAYDYLMALYLLTGQTEKLALQADRAGDLGYQWLPRHWDEALCIYLSQNPAMTQTYAGAPVRPSTIARLGSFLQAYAPYEDDPAQHAAAAAKLARDYGSTYYYFYKFQFSPGARR